MHTLLKDKQQRHNTKYMVQVHLNNKRTQNVLEYTPHGKEYSRGVQVHMIRCPGAYDSQLTVYVQIKKHGKHV